MMMGRGFRLLAYSVWLIHQSGADAIGVGAVVVVGVAIGVHVPGVGRVVGVRGAQPPSRGGKRSDPNMTRMPPRYILTGRAARMPRPAERPATGAPDP